MRARPFRLPTVSITLTTRDRDEEVVATVKNDNRASLVLSTAAESKNRDADRHPHMDTKPPR